MKLPKAKHKTMIFSFAGLRCWANCVAYVSQALRNKPPICKILVKAWFTLLESSALHVDAMKTEETNQKCLCAQLFKSKEVLTHPVLPHALTF